MDCRAVERHLSLYLDEELDPRVRLAVDVHLQRCAPCQASLRKIQNITHCLAQTRKQIRAPEDFSLSLQSRLRQLESRTFLSTARTTEKLRRTVMYSVLGVALLLAAGLFALLILVQQADQPMPAEMAQWRSTGSSLASRATSSATTLSFVRTRSAAPPQQLPPLPVSLGSNDSGPDQKPLASVSY